MDDLYDQYNRFVPDAEIQRQIEECHQQLIRSLEKPERKLILRIIDSKDLISGFCAKESFACGFWLAWRLLSQLRSYDNDRSLEESLKEGGRFAMQEGDTTDEA
ncbi:DUF6809 family protein [Lacrimispora sp. BS-2]|uniref:DUF6809 family protein n=1 Tax=Lacrimispora sp. BS-2 TaxID=3151850 RepID=A0AAU7PQR5_9FIRM